MVRAATPRRDEHGFSLVESVIAIAVLGTIVSAMVGGMATAITMSGLHRQEASANAVMLSAAEVVKHLPYKDCAQPVGTSPGAWYSTPAVPGWSIAVQVQYWDQVSTPPAFDSTCHDTDGTGGPFPMQLVTVLVTGSGSAVTDCPVYADPVQSKPKSTSCIAVVKRRP